MRQSDGPAPVRGGKAGSFALVVDENIERTKRKEVSFPKLDLGVVTTPIAGAFPEWGIRRQ